MKLKKIIAFSILAICLFFWLKSIIIFQPNPQLLTSGFDVFKKYPWLNNISTWQTKLYLSKSKPKLSELGAAAIGNGEVFAMAGLRLPLNKLFNIIGPTYQKKVGFLGEEAIELYKHNKKIELPKQMLNKVSGANIIITTCANSSLKLLTIDFAPPNLRAIVRILIVKNIGEHTAKSLKLSCEFSAIFGERSQKELILRRGNIYIYAGVIGANVEIKANRLLIPMPKIPAGGQAIVLHYLIIPKDRQDKNMQFSQISRLNFKLLQHTYSWWQAWLSETTKIECSAKKISDLIEDSKMLIKAQQAYNGGFSPMHQYSYCWIRDSNGPIRFFLMAGKFEDVLKSLDYYYLGSALYREVPNCLPVDLKVNDDVPQNIDWTKIKVQPAEASSFIILQHYWYYKFSGDLKPIRAHYEYLKRNILGQALSRDYKLPFHWDETYFFPAYEKVGGEFPKDYVRRDQWSLDSSIEFVVACEAMAKFAKLLGNKEDMHRFEQLAKKVRQTTEHTYWLPDLGFYSPAQDKQNLKLLKTAFANINLNLLWIDYLSASSKRAISNLKNTLKYLRRPDGSIKTTPSFAYYVGMNPGMLLYNLSATDHPMAEKALQWLLKAAEPLGEFAELYQPNHRPSDRIWGKNRIRPWEGGINLEALLFYLTGLKYNIENNYIELKPNLPPATASYNNYLKVKQCRISDYLLDFSIDAKNNKRTYWIKNRSQRAVKIKLLIVAKPGEKIKNLEAIRELPTAAATTPWGAPKIIFNLVLEPKEIWQLSVIISKAAI